MVLHRGRIHQNLMILVGERKHRIFRIGDYVKVKVIKAHISDGDIDFKIMYR